MTIRTLIVDDEAPARAWLTELGAGTRDLRIVGQCATATQAREKLIAGGIDLALLDVQLGPATAFDVLASIPAMRVPLVVFVTAFDRHAVRAFDQNAVDYLLKPVGEERFHRAMERVRAQMTRDGGLATQDAIRAALIPLQRAILQPHESAGAGHIVAERDGAFHVLKAECIETIDVAPHSNYVAIHAQGDPAPFTRRDTLQGFLATLDSEIFLRIRRNLIVNLGHVARIERVADDFVFILRGDRAYPVGRSYRSTIAEFLRNGRPGHAAANGLASQ